MKNPSLLVIEQLKNHIPIHIFSLLLNIMLQNLTSEEEKLEKDLHDLNRDKNILIRFMTENGVPISRKEK